MVLKKIFYDEDYHKHTWYSIETFKNGHFHFANLAVIR